MVSFTGKLGRSDSLHRHSSVLDQLLKKDQNMESINELVSFHAVSVSYIHNRSDSIIKELSCFKVVVKTLNVQQPELTAVVIITYKLKYISISMELPGQSRNLLTQQ